MSKLTLDELDELKPIGSYEAPRGRHLALIGPSGSGKTTYCVSGPGRVFVALTEPQARGRVLDSNPNAIVQVITNRDDLITVLEWLRRKQLEVQPDGSIGRFERIVLDSASELIRFIQDEIDREAASGGGQAASGKKAAAPGEWTHVHWATFEKRVTTMLRAFRDLPNTQLVAIFLDELQKGDDGAIGVRRMLCGRRAMAGRLASLFDLVFWMVTTVKRDDEGKERVVHAIRTGGPGIYLGDMLEQGKGHPALPMWIKPEQFPPAKLLAHINNAARGAVAEASSLESPADSAPDAPAEPAATDNEPASGQQATTKAGGRKAKQPKAPVDGTETTKEANP